MAPQAPFNDIVMHRSCVIAIVSMDLPQILRCLGSTDIRPWLGVLRVRKKGNRSVESGHCYARMMKFHFLGRCRKGA